MAQLEAPNGAAPIRINGVTTGVRRGRIAGIAVHSTVQKQG